VSAQYVKDEINNVDCAGTLFRSSSTAIRKEFQKVLEGLENAGREVDRVAHVEHLYQTDHARKGMPSLR
jgi:hypothetical protein